MKDDILTTTRKMSLGGSLMRELASSLLSKKSQQSAPSSSGENIIIFGGELFNKGAQAMTFTVVDQMAKRFPKKDVYLLSSRDYSRPDNEKSLYEFDILPWGTELQHSLLSPRLEFLNTRVYPKEVINDVREIISNAYFALDISGYAFSSQMGFNPSITYLTNIVICEVYSLPIYILPQSIGPFEYSENSSVILSPLMKEYLSYPQIICPRESAGVEALAPYSQDNVQKEFDIVLQNDSYTISNIFSKSQNFEQKEVPSGSVGIVPNSKVFERGDTSNLLSLYNSIIKEALSKGRAVSILRHSTEDLEYCEMIKDLFPEEDSVRLVGDELNAIELEHMINQLDFLIGSRYHSLIHAYKNSVPVLAIGWAIKYKELLEEFKQSQYFFDGREDINEEEFIVEFRDMHKNHETNSKIIESRLNRIQQNNLFDRLFSQ